MIKEGGGVIHLPTFYIKKFIEDPDLWLSDWSAAKTFFYPTKTSVVITD